VIASPDSIGAPVATDGAIHLGWPVTATGLMLGLAIVLITIRLLRGPSLADRVIALDLLGTVTAAAIGLYAVARDEPVYLYVAMAIALLLFVGTVAFAYYIERGPRPAPAAAPEDAEAGS
jgi:multicomponent Na+:H+ antiporter subunit F